MIEDKILKNFKGKNVLVTGGTGMIGRQVVDILYNAGANIKIVSLDRININKKIEHVYGDLCNFDFCKEITKDMEFVFHIAGLGASVSAAKEKIASHFVPMVMMNTNMLEAARINKAKKLVYTSTIGAYAPAEIFRENEYVLGSDPMDFGGWAKRIGEIQIHTYRVQYGLNNFAIVRPAGIYGPGDNFNPSNSLVIPSLMYRIRQGENPLVVWGDGSAIRDFVFSGDAAEGIIQALFYGTDSGFVNLGSGRPCTIRELVETLRGFLKFEYKFDPSKPTGSPKRIMDISLARRLIHYNPSTPLEEGLKITWEWYLGHPDEYINKMNYFK